jgi:tungstate transport system ATP-binding protein
MQEGEILAFAGPNGAGKSTLLQVLALLQKPTNGVVFFRGHAVSNRNALDFRRRMAVVFQESLLLNTTVFKGIWKLPLFLSLTITQRFLSLLIVFADLFQLNYN